LSIKQLIIATFQHTPPDNFYQKEWEQEYVNMEVKCDASEYFRLRC